MTIDGFEPGSRDAFSSFSDETSTRLFSLVERISARLEVKVDGLDCLPEGRTLLVANHAFGWDVIFPMAAIYRRLGRRVWVLGEHLWWEIPFLRRLASAVGLVDGTPENVDRLLDRDETVLVLPGGLREAVKPRELRYRLLWGDRYGFIRAAIRNQTPMVPLASVGADDWFDLVGNAFARGERLLHRKSIPIPRLFPVPHLVPLQFRIGAPIAPRYARASSVDEVACTSMRREVEGALHEMLEEALARRAGINLHVR